MISGAIELRGNNTGPLRHSGYFPGSDMHIELSLTEDNHIHLVLDGEGHGELLFHNYSAFAAFIKKCLEFVDSYEAFTEIYGQPGVTETPIPQPFLDAFDE